MFLYLGVYTLLFLLYISGDIFIIIPWLLNTLILTIDQSNMGKLTNCNGVFRAEIESNPLRTKAKNNNSDHSSVIVIFSITPGLLNTVDILLIWARRHTIDCWSCTVTAGNIRPDTQYSMVTIFSSCHFYCFFCILIINRRSRCFRTFSSSACSEDQQSKDLCDDHVYRKEKGGSIDYHCCLSVLDKFFIQLLVYSLFTEAWKRNSERPALPMYLLLCLNTDSAKTSVLEFATLPAFPGTSINALSKDARA